VDQTITVDVFSMKIQFEFQNYSPSISRIQLITANFKEAGTWGRREKKQVLFKNVS